MVITGGMRIRNARTGGSGTLGLVVRNTGGRLLGLTNHHVLYGFKQDPVQGQAGDPVEVEAEEEGGGFVPIGKVGATHASLDATLIELDTADPNLVFKPYQVREHEMIKLDATALQKGMSLYKYGAGSAKWTKGILRGYNKSKVDIKGNGILSVGGDSGAVWVAGPAPYRVCALHYWGSNDGRQALAKNIHKVIQAFSLLPSAQVEHTRE